MSSEMSPSRWVSASEPILRGKGYPENSEFSVFTLPYRGYSARLEDV